MLEQELKSKIAHTISRYKLKCNQLEDEISVLKSAIYQLSLLPNGIHVGLDKQMRNLRTNLKENKDSKKIKKSVELLVNAMSNLNGKKQTKTIKTDFLLDTQVNNRLSQLLEHIQIPEELVTKYHALKIELTAQLTIDAFIKVVDSISDLVIETFNFEHNLFKGFLDRFSGYLHDLGKLLDLTDSNHVKSQHEAEKFESELLNNIKRIQTHLNEAKTIEELSNKIEKSLNEINQQINLYCENEQLRLEEYDEKITILQTKLEEAECGTEKLKNDLSFNKVKINYDSITGLPNRMGYEEYSLGAFHRWQRGFGNVSLAIADIDQLKKMNEDYGSLAADQILKKIATIFKSSIRAVDFVGRYGDKDFIFIFERTAVHDTLKILENLKIALEEAEFYCGDTKVIITASFGLSALQHGDNLDTVFARVDEARYEAKRMGTNQVVIL